MTHALKSENLNHFPLVIVTGGTGWLGQRVVTALTQGLPLGDNGTVGAGGMKVRALVTPQERQDGLRALGVECVVGDVTDPDARTALLKNAEGALVIHLAGIIHPRLFVSDFQKVNTQGTLGLHKMAAKAGVQRMVVMSSNSPLGLNPSADHLFDEESPYHPYMGYGFSKMLMEQGLKAASVAGQGPDTVVVRAPWFYGPGQPLRQTTFFSMVKNGKFPLMGAGGNKRSMGYVDSLTQGILLAAATAHAAGRTYWLADERAYSMREIVDTVKAVLHDDFGMAVAAQDWVLPPVVSDVARLADSMIQAVGLYQQKIHVLSEMNATIACSIERAKRELGYAPLVELREGMRRSVEYCLARGDKI